MSTARRLSAFVRRRPWAALAPALGLELLDALAHGWVEDLGRIDRSQPHRVAAQRNAGHFPLAAICAKRMDIHTVEPARICGQLLLLTCPVQPHAFDHGAHHNPSLAGVFERGEWAAVEVEALQRRGGSIPAVAVASVEQPIGYSREHIPGDLAGAFKGSLCLRLFALSPNLSEQFPRQPVEFLVR
ncbi:hypothetical protein MCBMB27_02101 [Methylobacterium phyllosphaerae]|uniref:Uncharacterized protein n=1 Tax=Methylobacterium phyllosphaerae TaxID=418223 RepID=A0AAE8L5R5_9HYPH|nr:hypothetical protein [Methylobacterium phyllosphaerae]APT31392.1 hypothetical protein MCBMB27_02101 [Methylobacterium phyllosphaerae]SFG64499.1 hypothetical protein SAMN05192567_10650 [Methylobacterium phyllosphaerae]